MRKTVFYLLIIMAATLIWTKDGYTQNDVVSFNPNNTWDNPFDLDQDTIWAYSGDCVDAPLYIYFMALEAMYAFRNNVLIDTNFVLLDVSFWHTIFADRFTRPEIIQTDSITYVIRVDSIFSTPYYPEPVVRVALRFKLGLNENSAAWAHLLLLNQILTDSTGYWINHDDAHLTIVVNHLPYERGDLDHDSLLTQNDMALLLQYIYQNGPPPMPPSLGDINRDCIIDIEDVLHLIRWSKQ